jgi:stalled ribosome rescue protein Dom34
VFHIEPTQVDSVVVKAPPRSIHHKHAKGHDTDKEHPDDAKRFYAAVCSALEGSAPILIVGPGSSKLEFLRYVQMHAKPLELRIAGIETVDHPSDGQLVAYAKKYFAKVP